MKKTILYIFLLFLIAGCSSPKISDKTTSIPSLDELSSEWMDVATLCNLPSVMNFIGGLQSTPNILAFQFLTLPPHAQTGSITSWDESIAKVKSSDNWSCEILLEDQPLIADEIRWLPYEVQRKVFTDEIEMQSSTRMPVEQKGVFLRLTIENKSSESKEINLSMNAHGRVRSYSDEEWRNWGNKRPYDNEFTAQVNPDKKSILIQDKLSSSVVMYSFVNMPANINVTGDKGNVKWNIALKPNEKTDIDIVYAVDDNIDRVAKCANDWSTDFDKQFETAKSDWEERWLSMFTPDNKYFSGHLPTLVTDDSKISRVYYHGALIPLLLCRTGYPLSKNCFVTAGPRWANTLIYFWDLEMWANVWALLDPKSMKEQIIHWFSVDFHQCYAIECFTGKGAGPWYAANDFSIFRAIEAYIEVTGDKKFLQQMIHGETLLQHLDKIAIYFESRPLVKGSMLANYGSSGNLLECSPSYIEGISSLNAANVYMLRKTATYYEYSGQQDRAKELRSKAESLLQEVLTLYEDGQGVWNALNAKGEKVPIRHCYDYIVIGQALENDLSPKMKSEMNNFVETELRTRTWMRAMSLKDPAAEASDRPDHGPMGSYDGWPPMTMDVMCRFGEFGKALEFLYATEEITRQGPWSQAHEFLGPESRGYDPIVRTSSRGGQDANEGCGTAFTETVIRSFFGFRPDLSNNTPVLLSPDVPRGFKGELKHLQWKDKMYTITSDEKGVKMLAE